MPVAEAPPQNPLLRDIRGQRLSEAYAPCFALILQLRGSREFGDEPTLRQRILKLLDQAERDARNAGCTSEDVDAATFALVAFIDETILSSDWSQKGQWLSRPLQLQRFSRYDAGEYFFERLDMLRSGGGVRAEALEVYYLCMALGFKGQYMLHEQEKLRLLIEQVHSELSAVPGMKADRLAPHGMPNDKRPGQARGSLPTWAILVIAVGVGLVIYLAMFVFSSMSAGDTAEFIDQLPR
jgi:type VI secretion system protein ImpK